MSSDPPSSPQTQRIAALEAAQRRAAEQRAQAPHVANGDIPSDAKLTYLKIINDQILERNPRPQALDALDLILTLLSNAQSDVNKRSIRLTNAQIKRRLGQVKGAEDYLLQCCWAPKTVSFEPHLVFPSSPNAKQQSALTWGHMVLQERLTVLHERWNKAQEAHQLNVAEESTRKKRAMDEFRDDRVRAEVRSQRERVARERQQEQEQQQQQQYQQEHGYERENEASYLQPVDMEGGHVLGHAPEDKKDQ